MYRAVTVATGPVGEKSHNGLAVCDAARAHAQRTGHTTIVQVTSPVEWKALIIYRRLANGRVHAILS